MGSVTKINRAEARKLREDGCTLAQLGEYYGVTRQRMSQVLMGVGDSVRPGPDRTFDYAEARRMWHEGASMGRLAKHFGVTKTTIRKALRSS